ncbi:MerR family transcriptional regulator [Pseudonocardia sp. Ae150A_Ps1]|uniref:MerR family transcriptional regulator n=2 Tax=Pseudonocardia TaxID=1847 RepID=UPI001BB0CF53|nr:MerR family transcriptional regulator [Pseudonocardia sp. Ae150A_Ps1]
MAPMPPPAPEPRPSPHGADTDYRIDDLARAAGMTVRNVRSYQERGLLHPPRRDGRRALYDDTHLGRLRIIGRLLDRGYTTVTIAELLAEWERGRDLGVVLGLETAVSALWPPRPATPMTPEALTALFPGADVDALVAAGLVHHHRGTHTAPSQQILAAAADLVRAGVPSEVVLDLARRTTTALDGMARDLLDAVVTHLVDGGSAVAHPDDALPDDSAADRAATALRSLTPALTTGIAELLAATLERHSVAVLDARAGLVLGEHPSTPSV